jgi:hypothetical protein
MPPRKLGPAAVVLGLLAFLLLASPSSAQDRSDRASAERALKRVESLLSQSGIRDKRKLTLALAALARQKSELAASDRKRAAAILARPTNGKGPGQWSAPPGDRRFSCTSRFCVHWVETTSDAPPTTDVDENGLPDFVDLVVRSFDESFDVEVGDLGWLPPLDDDLRGGSDLIDIYLSDIGDDAYGFAVPEDQARSSSSYLVLDNDYSASQFPRYGGNPTIPAQATAAHEFNHVLQFRYDSLQDDWMMESTATWAEEKVFDAANDYRSYVIDWAATPEIAIASADSKMYGSAIWNHWLDDRFGEDIIREAWEGSQLITVDGGGFAPSAYDRAIKSSGGTGFAAELQDFTAATAEWDASNSGIHEGSTFSAEVDDNGQMPLDGGAVANTLNHTAFALYDVPRTGASQIFLTGGLPAGVPGSIALVGFDEATGTQSRVVVPLDADGQVTATLDDPPRFERLTAVITNSDVSNTGVWNAATRDWTWTKDAQPFTLAATTSAPVESTPTTTPTVSPTVTPTVDPPPPPPPLATSVRLSRSSTKLPFVARKGVLSFFVRTNKAGRVTAKATIDRATARRLRVGRRTTTAGTGRRTATAPARLKVNVRLTKKLRSALRRHNRRSVKIRVRVRFVPTDGTATVRRTISIRLRP